MAFTAGRDTAFISIHTPTKGVTAFQTDIHPKWIYFNPHSHQGSDPISSMISTGTENFNPHSHEGSDYIPAAAVEVEVLFQSTLPRRE